MQKEQELGGAAGSPGSGTGAEGGVSLPTSLCRLCLRGVNVSSSQHDRLAGARLNHPVPELPDGIAT